MKIKFIIVFVFIFVSGLNAQNSRIDSLINQLDNVQGPEKAEIYYQLSQLYHLEDAEKSIYYGGQALSFAREFENKKEQYLAYRYIGNAYRQLGDFQKSNESHFQALEIAIELKDLNLQAGIYNDLGISYAHNGKFEKSMEFFLKALETFDIVLSDTNNRELMNDYALALNNLGMVCEILGLYDKSLEYYQKSMKISIEIDDQELVADLLNNIGLIYEIKGEYIKSLDYCKQALAIQEKLGLKIPMAIAFANIGLINGRLNNYDEAIEYNKKALELYKEFEDKYNEALIIANIADVYIDANQLDEAYLYILAAVELAKEINANEVLRISYEVLLKYYATTNEYQKAFTIHQELLSLKDSLYSHEMAGSIAEMQTKYETEKVEKENELLTKNAEIQTLRLKKQQTQFWILGGGISLIILLGILAFALYRSRQRNMRAQLEKKNMETEKRMLRSQMNPHFIFNAMSSIQGYITSNDNYNAMMYLSNFAELTRGILENSRQAMIPLADEIKTLNLYIDLERLRLKNKFDFAIEINPELDPESIYVPPMLIQPFVENAIKHGLKNKDGHGMLLIDFKIEKALIKCCVTDNGIGRDLTEKNKAEGHRSLGMQVTQERLEMLKKEKKVNCFFMIHDLRDINGKASGTRVDISLPFEEE